MSSALNERLSRRRVCRAAWSSFPSLAAPDSASAADGTRMREVVVDAPAENDRLKENAALAGLSLGAGRL